MLGVLSTKLCKMILYQRLSVQLSGSCSQCCLSSSSRKIKIYLSVRLINNVRGGGKKAFMTGHAECVCLSQTLKANGAEEEDNVEQEQTDSQPAVQPPAVQVDTQDLRRKGELVISCHTTMKKISYLSENDVKALRTRQEEDQMKIIMFSAGGRGIDSL